MLQVMRTVDNFIFDRFPSIQKISNKVEYLTCAKSATQAMFVMVVGSAFVGSILLNQIWDENDSTRWSSLALRGMNVILFFVQMLMTQNINSQRRGFRNILRKSEIWMFFRLLFLLIFVYEVGLTFLFKPAEFDWFLIAGSNAILFAYYFLACDNLPPGSTFWDELRQKKMMRA